MTDTSLSQTLIFGHLWQSVAIAAVLAGALIIGRRMRGSTRYGLGVAAFVASLALPLAAFIPGETIVAGLLKQLNAPVAIEAAAPKTQIVITPTVTAAPAAPVAPAQPVTVNGVELAPVSMTSVPLAPVAPAQTVMVTHEAAQPSSLFTLPAIPMPDIGLPLLLVWLGVAGFLIARTVRDLLAVERLVARARPADLPPALKARMNGIRVVVSPEAPGPMAAGLLRPAIVLPESIALGSPGMAGLLEHEHAHIRRHDMLAALGQRIVLALMWWSPALYFISRRIDEEREVACDEAAVDRTGDPKAFARSLTKQAENQLWVRAPRLAVGAIGPRSHFGRRVRRLIDLAKSGGSPAKYSGRLAFAGLAVAVGVAAMVTPRFTAVAQPTSKDAIDLTQPGAAAKAEADARNARDKLDGAPSEDTHSYRFAMDSEFSAFGSELEAMMAELGPMMAQLGPELEGLMAGFGPEMQAEMAGLSTELAALGIDIGAMVSQDVIAHLPQIMDEVQRSLDVAGDQDWKNMSEEERAEVRAALENAREEVRAAMDEAREEMKHALGPEMREGIRAALQQARAELAEHRDEIAAAMAESNNGMAIAREALAAARSEIEAARARGDFKVLENMNFNFDFDDAALDGASGVRIVKTANTPARDLFEAADDCDMTALNKLVSVDKVDVNGMVPGRGTALMAAADANCVDAARMLINAGADVNRGFPGRGTPLSIAAENSALPIVQLLLGRGADVNASQPGRHTPLVEAIREGDLAIVKALVEKGADINARSPQSGMRTPLDIAVREGHDEITAYLRARGAQSSAPARH